MSNWTQSCCDDCWRRREGVRQPIRIKEEFRENERCALCGKQHRSGIYVRQDPATVPYPAADD